MIKKKETNQPRICYATFPRDHEKLNSDWYRFYRLLYMLERLAPEEIDGKTTWLDIGCHSGAFLRALIHSYGLNGSGCDVYPVEDKEERKYECYQLTDNSHWSYRQLDVSKGLNWGQKFDVISALEVIEHMVDTDQFLDQVREHLVEGGLFVVTTPNINNLRNRLFVPLGRYPIGLEYRTVIHHVRLYNVKAIRDHFQARGFDVLGVRGVQMLPRSWLTRSRFLRWFSECVSDVCPGLATNIMVVARKRSTPSTP